MNRRSKQKSGFINFPVDNPKYKNSGEGGMFIRLVVEEKDNEEWMECCGGHQEVLMDESYIRDDIREPPKKKDWELYKDNPEKLKELFEIEERGRKEYEEFHFPRLNDKEYKFENYCSIPYLCALTVGSTGWSGWNEEKGKYWYCVYNDLTEDGKLLYDQLKKLYPNCNLYLQTWLDT